MAHSRLGIRSYVPEDLDEARFTISRSIMEPLAEANKRSSYSAAKSSTFLILTTEFPRLLPPVHYCSMGRTVVRIHRFHGLVAEFPILWRPSFHALPHSRLRDRGRPNLVLFRLVSEFQVSASSTSEFQTQGQSSLLRTRG